MEAKMTAEQMAALASELADLSKRQSDALMNATYFRMTPEESKAYDIRATRIGEICSLLGQSRSGSIKTKPQSKT